MITCIAKEITNFGYTHHYNAEAPDIGNVPLTQTSWELQGTLTPYSFIESLRPINDLFRIPRRGGFGPTPCLAENLGFLQRFPFRELVEQFMSRFQGQVSNHGTQMLGRNRLVMLTSRGAKGQFQAPEVTYRRENVGRMILELLHHSVQPKHLLPRHNSVANQESREAR